MLVDTGLSSKRFHTCIFNQDYISQRSVTARKCSRPFFLEMYQLQASTLNQFFFVQIWTQGAAFLTRKKNNPLEFHRTLMPTVFQTYDHFHLEPSSMSACLSSKQSRHLALIYFAYSKFDHLHKFWVVFNLIPFSNS